MDWISLRELIKLTLEPSLTERQKNLEALDQVLNNIHYQGLAYDFDQEKGPGNKFVPVSERRPSNSTGLCRTVVEDSVSLLFGDAHMPRIDAKNPETAKNLRAIFKAMDLQSKMTHAAIQGSIGSVALEFMLLDQKPLLRVHNSKNLTPEFHWLDESKLVRVTEKRKVARADLEAVGYNNLSPDAHFFWFMKVWDDQRLTTYLPWPISEKEWVPQEDPQRTVKHYLGECPIIWIKNLPTGCEVDGPCTFESAISVVMQMDTLWSMSGRGLKYNLDPIKVLTTDDDLGKEIVGGADRMLVFGKDSKFELLEMKGTSVEATLAWLREARNMALEQMHGLRAHSDKLTMPSSGVAIEMLHQPLIWLADKLRLTYGEGAILQLARMICKASHTIKDGLLINELNIKSMDSEGLSLIWPNWFEMTSTDLLQNAQAADYNIKNGVVSSETVTKQLAPVYEIEDIGSERKSIDEQRSELLAQQADAQQPKVPMDQ